MLEIKENMMTMNLMIQRIQYLFSPASAEDKIEEKIVSVVAQAVADIEKERLSRARGHRKGRSHRKVFWNRGCKIMYPNDHSFFNLKMKNEK